jgi:primosomal protein N'
MPEHEVIRAAVHADPSIATGTEMPLRERLRLPPVFALALIEGEGAPELADLLRTIATVELSPTRPSAAGTPTSGRPTSGRPPTRPSAPGTSSGGASAYLVRAPSHDVLCDALSRAMASRTTRSSPSSQSTVRIEVDPLRI